MTALAEREVVRCEHCSLMQFVTASVLCRRCHKSIAPPAPEPEPAPAPLYAPVRDLQIGATVRDLRIERHLSQRQLADRMCVNRTYISKTESGNNVPTLALLGRFAKGLQVNMSTLLGEDPVIAEIAPYIGHLDDSQRSIILDKVRELAAAK